MNRTQEGNDHQEESPLKFLHSLFPKEQQKRTRRSLPCHSDDEMEDYTMDVVRAVRAKDVAKLRDMLNDGTSFEACNSNGEYIIHLACRRSDLETVKFLVQEAGVMTSVRDDMGRSILHDVCWKSSPDTDLMDFLLRVCSPELLLSPDQRGHTPFDFARKAHWPAWNSFLQERQDMIRRRAALVMQ